MTYFSLAGTRLSINDIKAFSDVILAGFRYHAENPSPFKTEYRKNLIIMGGLSFAVILLKDPFPHNIGSDLKQFLLNRDPETDVFPDTGVFAHLISKAVPLIQKYDFGREDYEYALLKRLEGFFENVVISLTGKQEEAERLFKLLFG